MIGQRLSHYRITARIGAGGMGEVYRAQDTRLGRDVAIKLLPQEWSSHPDRLARFEREAKTVAALSHPNIVTLFSVEEADGVHFLTMELVEGKGLDALLTTGPLALERFFEIALPVADAVAAAHARGIVHRDLKPGNVMVTDEGQRVKVLDFGLAKPSVRSSFDGRPDSDSEMVTFTQTQEGVIVGTPHYMSPEQARGDAVDLRSDVFSLGVLFYEMATGERPFRGRSSIDLLSSVLKDQPPAVSEVRPELPRHLGRIVARCLEKDPGDRYQSARDVYIELRALQREEVSRSGAAGRSSGSAARAAAAGAAPRRAAPDESSSAESAESAEAAVPWVAVRPLESRTADPELETLADGLTEDITNGLSRFAHLLVVSHNSARALAGKPMDVRAVGRELGARYVMEGSLRRAGSRVRIAFNLIDARTGTHLWTETFDRDLERADVFDLQDDLTDRVVATVADCFGALTRSLALTTDGKPPETLTAHQALLRYFLFRHRVSAAEHLIARTALEHALEREPNHAELLAALAILHVEETMHGFNPRPDPVSRALAVARRAVEADPASQFAHFALAHAHYLAGDLSACRAAGERALQLNSRSSDTLAWLGSLTALAGDWQRGRELARRAMELNPLHPGWYHIADFYDAYRQGRDREALELAQRINMPEYWGDALGRTIAHAQLGNDEAARAAARDLLRVWPDFESEYGRERPLFDVALGERIRDGLRKAGLNVVEDPSPNPGPTAPRPERPASSGPLAARTSGIGTTARGSRPDDSSSGLRGTPRTASAVESPEGSALRSLAVLPFANLSADAENEFFADGVTEDILTRLAAVEDFRVISRTSAMSYKGSAKALRQIARELEVGSVVEGSVRRAGNRVRIVAQLIEATTDRQLWAETYDRDLDDVFAIQSDVAEKIAQALQARLAPELVERLRQRPTRNMEAYDLYLKGRQNVRTLRAPEIARGIEQLEEAIALDPDFTKAYAQLAVSHLFSAYWGAVRGREDYLQARDHAARALELDPSSALARVARAGVKGHHDFDWAGAIEDLEEAGRLDPNEPEVHFWHGLTLFLIGRFDEAVAVHRKARSKDPQSPNVLGQLSISLCLAGHREEGQALLREGIERHPTFFALPHFLAIALLLEDRFEEAATWIERTCELTGHRPLFEARHASILRLAGDEERARQLLDRLEARAGDPPVDEVVRALMAIAKHEVDDAVRHLGEAVEQRLPLALWLLRTFHESELPRDHPAVAALRRRLWPEPATSAAADQEASGMATRPARQAAPSSPGSNAAALRHTPLVGRDSERETLDRMLDATRDGRGGLVLLGGEPGVGKTRLASEILEDARGQGMLALEGHAYEDRGAPFVTATEILEEMLRLVPAAELRRMLGDNASEISRLLPALRRLWPDVPEPEEVPPEQQQRYLFNSLLEFLGRTSGERPLVMLLDDLHWADESSLLLLEHLAPRLPELPILMIGTYRDVEADMSPAFETTLENLVRQRLAERMQVRQLAQEAVAELLAAMSGQDPPAALVASIHHNTEGNAFFVEEVFRHLSEEGALFDERGRWRADLDLEQLDVPDGVRLVIGRRLKRLGEPARKTLSLASVMGLRFESRVLEEAVGDADATLDALDEAEAARLILAAASREGARYEFSHALVRHTLLDELSIPRLERQHLRIAEALERVYGERIDEHAGEMARHLRASGPRAEPGRTRHFLGLAGDRALASAAPEEAASYYDQALELETDLAVGPRAELLFRRGTARRSLGRWDEAAADWQEALPGLEAEGRTDLVTTTCHRLAYRSTWLNDTDDAIVFARRGLESAGERPSEGRCRLLAILGHAHNLRCEFETANELLTEALTLAEEIGAEDVLGGEVLLAHQFHYMHTVRPLEWVEVAERAVELARRSGRPWDLSAALGTSVLVYPSLGRFERGRVLADEAEPLALQEGDLGSVAHVLLARAMARFAAGDLEAARQELERCYLLFREHAMPWATYLASMQAVVRQLQGDFDGARADLETAMAEPIVGSFAGVEPGQLLRHLAYAADERAVDLLVELEPRLPAAGVIHSIGSCAILSASVEAAALLGRTSEAGRLYPQLRQLLDDGTVWLYFEGLIERLAGIAAAAAGRHELATAHFETALEQAERLPVVPERPLVRYWYARALLEGADDGDRARARELLHEARELSESVGTRGLLDRIDRALRQTETAP